jgi:predicted permease
MLAIFEALIPVVAITTLGYFAAARGLLRSTDIEGLSRFVFSLALPLLLFDSVTTAPLPETFEWPFFFAFYGVSFLIFGLAIWAGRRWFKMPPAEQAMFGLGACYSNLVLVGLPIIVAGLGEEAILPLFALVSVQNLLLFPAATLVASQAEKETRILARLWTTVKSVVANPLIAGLLIGFVLRIVAIKLPGLVVEPIHLLGQTGLPCALIVVGASFHKYQMRRPTAQAATMVGLKMILQPLLVWVLAFAVLHLQPIWAGVAVMAAGMPTGINAYMLAEQLDAGQQTVSASIWISSLISILSQAGLLALLLPKV